MNFNISAITSWWYLLDMLLTPEASVSPSQDGGDYLCQLSRIWMVMYVTQIAYTGAQQTLAASIIITGHIGVCP